MKKILAGVVLVLAAIPAMAQHHGHRGHWYRGHGGHWQWAPWVGGAIAGAVIYDIYNRPVVVQQPPVVVQQPPVIIQSQSPVIWIDGVAYTKQIMIINGVQQEVLIRN